jgi:hypothetical protein
MTEENQYFTKEEKEELEKLEREREELEKEEREEEEREKPFKDFNYCKMDYFGTIRTVVGCGRRGQIWMDEAYIRLQTAYNALTDEQQKKVTLPEKQTCHDDGMMGLRSGFASIFSRN